MNALVKKIDTHIIKNIPYDTYHTYGLVAHYFSYDKKVVNLGFNPLTDEDCEIAMYDDRYQMIWYHRLNSIRIDSDKSYGNQIASNDVEYLTMNTIFWSQKKYSYLGNPKKLENHYELYSMLLRIFQTLPVPISITSIDVDNTKIEKEEFIDNRLSTESILLKFNYAIKQKNNDNCINNCKEFKYSELK